MNSFPTSAVIDGAWTSAATLRQGLYRFFGEALSPPTAEWATVVGSAALWLDDLGVEPFAFNRQWQQHLSILAEGIELGHLESEYIRLFATAMDPSVSPPTESFYRAKAKGGGVAELQADLVREYLALGISLTGRAHAPDHVATELEVMSMLCAQEARAWTDGRLDLVSALAGKQARFLRRHLAVWFPMFKDHVLAASPGPFYRSTVETAHAFLTHDADFAIAIEQAASP